MNKEELKTKDLIEVSDLSQNLQDRVNQICKNENRVPSLISFQKSESESTDEFVYYRMFEYKTDTGYGLYFYSNGITEID